MLFRTYDDGTLRAVLSNIYGIIDNAWYVKELSKLIPSGRLSHWRGDSDTIWGNVLIPDSVREVDDSDYGGMLSIGNSEIGTRAWFQRPSIFRAICMNGCIWDQVTGITYRKVHRGKIDYEQMRRALASNVNSQIPLLDSIVDAFLNTRSLQMSTTPELLVAELSVENDLTVSETNEILNQYKTYEADKPTAFGFINAITRAGQKFSNERWFGFDMMAGKFVTSSAVDWESFNKRSLLLKVSTVDKVYGRKSRTAV